MVDFLRYEHPDGRSYAELMSGKRFAPATHDLHSGTVVALIGYDEESAWPIAEWIDGNGATRLTTIDPVFAEFFTPVLKEEELW